MKWPWQRDRGPEQAARDMSIDAYATEFLNFGGNVYPSNMFGGGANGLFQFGGFGATGGSAKPNEEIASDDFEALAGGIYKASAAVFSVHNYRRALFSQARLCLQKLNDDDRPGDLANGPDLKVLRTPWEGGTTEDLLTRAIIHADIGGNAFMVRDVLNGKDQIKLLRPDWVTIVMSGDPKKVADATKLAIIYKPGNTQDVKNWKIYPFDGSNGAVAHWAPIPDPVEQYRGMSWLDPIINEALTDKAMSVTKLRYFQNGAKPGIVASFDPSVEPEQAQQFQELFQQTKVGADNAYKTMFLGGGCSVSTFKLEPTDFEKISSIGELRIAAVAQVQPTLVGLTESMKGSALNEGNFQAAKDAFADGTMRPLWNSFCSAAAALVDIPKKMRLWYDDRDIAFLRQDQQLIAQRKQTDATTIARLVQDGFTPDAAVRFVMEDDFSVLLGDGHSGLYSVQLTPPGLGHMTDFAGDAPTEDVKTTAQKLASTPASPNDPIVQAKPGGKPTGQVTSKKPGAASGGK